MLSALEDLIHLILCDLRVNLRGMYKIFEREGTHERFEEWNLQILVQERTADVGTPKNAVSLSMSPYLSNTFSSSRIYKMKKMR